MFFNLTHPILYQLIIFGQSITPMVQINMNNCIVTVHIIVTAHIIVNIIDIHVIIKYITSFLTNIFPQLFYSLIYHK
jgi:hypothetical protein